MCGRAAVPPPFFLFLFSHPKEGRQVLPRFMRDIQHVTSSSLCLIVYSTYVRTYVRTYSTYYSVSVYRVLSTCVHSPKIRFSSKSRGQRLPGRCVVSQLARSRTSPSKAAIHAQMDYKRNLPSSYAYQRLSTNTAISELLALYYSVVELTWMFSVVRSVCV